MHFITYEEIQVTFLVHVGWTWRLYISFISIIPHLKIENETSRLKIYFWILFCLMVGLNLCHSRYFRLIGLECILSKEGKHSTPKVNLDWIISLTSLTTLKCFIQKSTKMPVIHPNQHLPVGNIRRTNESLCVCYARSYQYTMSIHPRNMWFFVMKCVRSHVTRLTLAIFEEVTISTHRVTEIFTSNSANNRLN